VKCCSPRYAEAERQFGPAIASRDLNRYHRKGPDAASRMFLQAVSAQVSGGDSVLDIGAGVGVLDFELLADQVQSATLVDASPAYLDAARREAESRGLGDRVQCFVGDFTSLGPDIASADVVTMHRVVCCYPDQASLLSTAASHARRVLAFSYPRDRWYVRAWMAFENVRRRLFGNPFRTFLHRPRSMEAVVIEAGFRPVQRSRTLVWAVDVYQRISISTPHPINRQCT
jgi:SAM-dependent methyltransferase